MPGLSLDDLEHKWRTSPYSDVKKTYDISSQYVSDSGIDSPFSLGGDYTTLNASHACGFEVKNAIENFSGANGSVEYLVAGIKREMSLQHINKIAPRSDMGRLAELEIFSLCQYDTPYIKPCDSIFQVNFILRYRMPYRLYIAYRDLDLPANAGIAILTPLLPAILKNMCSKHHHFV